MKIYDISQEVLHSVVFPGDPMPQTQRIASMEKGDLYNLTTLSMCAHNGTHVDAPCHFIQNGKSVEQLSLEKMVGYATVIHHDGIVSAEDAKNILEKQNDGGRYALKRILFKGKTVVSLEAARVFAEAKIDLLGNESQTVGPEDAPMAVHQVLLGAEVVLLEGIRLHNVPEGVYLLCAAPISLAGADGAPCRAVLVEIE